MKNKTIYIAQGIIILLAIGVIYYLERGNCAAIAAVALFAITAYAFSILLTCEQNKNCKLEKEVASLSVKIKAFEEKVNGFNSAAKCDTTHQQQLELLNLKSELKIKEMEAAHKYPTK